MRSSPGSVPRSPMGATGSSSTSSRISTRSSTSDGRGRRLPAGRAAVLAGFLRLVHPFPSLLDGAVVLVVALIAGAGAETAVLLGASMTALQFSIGAMNDIVDAPRDGAAKRGKPIPAGVVSRTGAAAVVVGAAGAGLVVGWLAGPFGGSVVALGLLVLAIGFAYDTAFKGTAWSWIPFAVGIPVLPVYAWVGATGGIPASFAILIPVAVIAGAGLAVANARADEDRDRASTTSSVATRLGGAWSWRVDAGCMAVVSVAAVATLLSDDAGPLALAGVVVGAVTVALGLVVGRTAEADRRERSWEFQAVGVAVLAASWLAGVPLAG
ncbi:MAG: UbiA family prenyltransferase [Chloroflexota bacterium]